MRGAEPAVDAGGLLVKRGRAAALRAVGLERVALRRPRLRAPVPCCVLDAGGDGTGDGDLEQAEVGYVEEAVCPGNH